MGLQITVEPSCARSDAAVSTDDSSRARSVALVDARTRRACIRRVEQAHPPRYL
jgi:hypothetical protein